MDEKDIETILKNVPGSKRAARGVIIEGDGYSFYAHGIDRVDDDLSREELFFQAFCSKHEIYRLRDIKNAHDYLLRFRAISLVDSARKVRQISQKREQYEVSGKNWSLSAYYHTLNNQPKSYIKRLSRSDRKKIKAIPFGFAPIDEVNALCIKSLAGDVVVVSETLQYFFYFMVICLYGNEFGFDLADSIDAGIIATRILIGSESADFELDPRGILQESQRKQVQNRVDKMIEFTFGHEFAHFLCGHNADPYAEDTGHDINGLATYSHAKEFEADRRAVNNVVNDRKGQVQILCGAYDAFLSLHLIELLAKTISDIPKFSVSETHPGPVERIHRLRAGISILGQPSPIEIDNAIDAIEQRKNHILQRVAYINKPDLFSFYGSMYLPNLKGKLLTDRIDF